MECQYCKNILSSKYNLQLHQKRVKYCLEIQKKSNINIVSELIECEYCKKQQSKLNFERHKNTCKISLIKRLKQTEEKLIEKEKEIESLKAQLDIFKNLSVDSQQCIKDIAKQPKTTNNNSNNTNILNLAPLDMDELTERITHVINNNMTEQHLIDGQEGVAKLVAKCFINEDGKKLITCTDISRGIWKSKDKDGNIIKDHKAKKIANAIKPIAVIKADKIIEIDGENKRKINELKQIQKRRSERIIEDENDEAFLKGVSKDSVYKRIYEDRIHQRYLKHLNDEKVEKSILEDFERDSLTVVYEDEEPFKLIMGKADILNMSNDSSKFSNALVNKL